MKTKWKTFILVGSLSALFFSSCKKEPSKNDPTYIVTKATYYDDNGSVDFAASYTYNGKQVSRIDVTGNADVVYYTFEYKDNQMVKRNEFASATSTTPSGYITINYNSDGTVRSIEHSAKTSTTDYSKDMITTFTYTDKHLTKAIVSDNSGGNSNTLQTEYDYTYTNNNISSVKIIDLTTTPHNEETVAYTYDSNPNYFAKLYPQPLLTDLVFTPFDESAAPITLSSNNVVGVGFYGYNYPINYTTDDHKNLTEVKIGGMTAVKYEIKQL